MMPREIRAAFEAWAKDQDHTFDLSWHAIGVAFHSYHAPKTQTAWEAFLAGMRHVKSAPTGEPLTVTYRNYRGEVALRKITPQWLWYGATEWHPKPQWLLSAFDHDKGASRDFALADFGHPLPWKERKPE